MKSAKPLPPPEELARCYRVNNECPSGLERIGSPTRKSGALGPTGGIGSDGYWRVTHRGSSYRIHRIIWALVNGQDPGALVIDHRDGDPQNNSIENLRACTEAENLQNKRSPVGAVLLWLSAFPKECAARVTFLSSTSWCPAVQAGCGVRGMELSWPT